MPLKGNELPVENSLLVTVASPLPTSPLIAAAEAGSFKRRAVLVVEEVQLPNVGVDLPLLIRCPSGMRLDLEAAHIHWFDEG